MNILITGGAGFIGVNLARRFIADGHFVAIFDNYCRGRPEHFKDLSQSTQLYLTMVDLADLDAYRSALADVMRNHEIDEIWHLAANSDIPAGNADPRVDLADTFITTFNTLTLMREFRIGLIAFASSSAVYGDLGEQYLREDSGPLLPISNYGAMKLASEAAISAAVESDLDRAYIFRFPNVIGVPATHGVILDFIRRLRSEPSHLDVLGNGTQRKNYLHVDDLVDAMLFIRNNNEHSINLFNIGAEDDGVSVRFIAEQVVSSASSGAMINFGTEDRGWVGDVPKFSYSTNKLSDLGWRPRLNSQTAVRQAIQEILVQEFGE